MLVPPALEFTAVRSAESHKRRGVMRRTRVRLGWQVATAEPHKEHVVEVLAFSEVGRKVTEALALQRLVAGDLPTTLVLLKALAQVGSGALHHPCVTRLTRTARCIGFQRTASVLRRQYMSPSR
jgi:hypothetical protein